MSTEPSPRFLIRDVIAMVSEFAQVSDCRAVRQTCREWRRVMGELAKQRLEWLAQGFAPITEAKHGVGRAHSMKGASVAAWSDDDEVEPVGDRRRSSRTATGTVVTTTEFSNGIDERHSIRLDDVEFGWYKHHHQARERYIDRRMYFDNGLRVVVTGQAFEMLKTANLSFVTAPPATIIVSGEARPSSTLENHPDNGERWRLALRRVITWAAVREGVVEDELLRTLPRRHRVSFEDTVAAPTAVKDGRVYRDRKE